MKTLISGASGFLGRSISKEINGQIFSVGRFNADIICDLSINIPQIEEKIDTVIHAAGKAHSIPKTVKEKQEFFNVNVKGTQNLLMALERSPSLPKSFVFISSVAVYGSDTGQNIDENHLLKAKDTYGLSKIQAEWIVREWCNTHGITCSILRLPLLVGPNPPGNLGAMIKAIRKGYYMNIAGGQARKSMVLVADVAKIIPQAAGIGGIYNLTDGYHPNFQELGCYISKQLNKREPYNIPEWMANMVAKVGDILGEKFPFNSYKLSKLTTHLTFDDKKAKERLGWNPRKVLNSSWI